MKDRRTGFDPSDVDALLETGGGLLSELGDGYSKASSGTDIDRWLGQEVGAYRITEFLDRGGMALVFKAERADGEYEQQVAIKLLRTTDGSELASRFERERQLLARLEHPSIAHIIDSGTADGQPWIAMELVDGMSIDAYCDSHKLNLDQRLALFCQAAQAVQFAHGHLVVHRDIKPSNILVSTDGQPKLLDFGIAKALETETSDVTLTGSALLMTPMYASPEQVLGKPIGVASDVYQLGLVLYRLLTGSNAQMLDSASVAQIKAVVVDSDPLSPSGQVHTTGEQDESQAVKVASARATTTAKLAKTLHGDLDAVVLKALEKDPGRRYLTVQQLTDDIDNFLASRPVAAQAQTGWYRAKRFVQRHRGGVSTVGLAALALVAGVVLASMGMFAAQRSQGEALKQADRAEAIADFMVSVFDANDPRLEAGEEVTAQRLLDNATVRIDEELAEQPTIQVLMLERIGVAQKELGRYDEAELQLLRALELHDALLSEPGARADVEHALGLLYHDMGRFDEAIKYLRSAMGNRNRYLQSGDPDIATATRDLGLALSQTDRVGEAIEVLSLALTQTPMDDSTARSATLNNLGLALSQAGDKEAALSLYQEAIAIDRRLGMEIDLAEKLSNVGMVYMEAGQFTLAKEHFFDGLTVMERFYGPEHPDLIVSINNLAHVHSLEKNFSEALLLYRRAQRVADQALGAEHWHSVILRLNVANLIAGSGQFDTALPEYRSAVSDLRDILGLDHHLSHRIQTGLAGALTKTGAISEAKAILADARAKLSKIAGPNHEWVAQTLTGLADTQLTAGEPTLALESANAALAIQDATGKEADPFRVRALAIKAAALNELGRSAESKRILLGALSLTASRYGAEHSTPLDLQRRLCNVEVDAGELDAAQKNCAAALNGARANYPMLDVIQVAESTLASGRSAAAANGCESAEEILRQALRLAEEVSGSGALATWPYRVAYADCLNIGRNFAQAAAQATHAREILERQLSGSKWQHWIVDSVLAESGAGLGNAAATDSMNISIEKLERLLPASPQLKLIMARSRRISD